MEPSNIASMCANLTLADVDDDDTAMHLPNVVVEEGGEEVGYYAVCRLVTNKNVKFTFFQDTMMLVWQPVMGVTMRQLQTKRYLVRFYHDGELNRIMNDGPWTYEQGLLVMRRLLPNEDLESVELNHTEFWVQIHSLPVGFRSDVVVQAIGSFLGIWIKNDERNFDGSILLFFRVRVLIDVTKPLKKHMKLKRDDQAWSIVEFKFERLLTFCFLCGIIGHGEKVCIKALQGIDNTVEKPYGAYMRAGLRRSMPLAGQRWVAPQTNADRQNWKSPSAEIVEKGKAPLLDPSLIVVVPDTQKVNEPEVTEIVMSEQKRKRVDGDAGRCDKVTSDMDVETVEPKTGLGAGLA